MTTPVEFLPITRSYDKLSAGVFEKGITGGWGEVKD